MRIQNTPTIEEANMRSIATMPCDDNKVQMTIISSLNSSSLQQPKEAKGINAKSSITDANYFEWALKHPSALRKFDQMMSIAKEKKVVVFLDYDGTLSPIVDDPNHAFMPDQMRLALSKVAQCLPTCIISGRCREKVHEFVQLPDVCYVGSHGMDITIPLRSSRNDKNKFQKINVDEKGNDTIVFQPAQEFLPMIEEITKELEEKIKVVPGSTIENNKFCVTVHFRRVEEKNWSNLEEQVKDTVKDYPHLRLTKGKKVIEIRPAKKWDKGCALEYLLDTLGFGSIGALPLYIGDDRTDEDAFKVLRTGERGIPIVVSSIPKKTKASYSLRDPSEVMSFLLRLSKWKKGSSRQEDK